MKLHFQSVFVDMKFFNEVEKKQNFKGKSTFWEFSFCIQKRPLIINITAFLLKKSFHAFFHS